MRGLTQLRLGIARLSASSGAKLGQRRAGGPRRSRPRPATPSSRFARPQSSALRRELAEAGRPVLGRDGRAGRVLAGGEQLEDVGLGLRADVERLLGAGVVERGEVGADDVADVDVVAGLAAVAEDASASRRRAACRRRSRPRPPRRAGPGAARTRCRSAGRRVRPVEPVEELEVVLAAELEMPYGDIGRAGGRLRRRDPVRPRRRSRRRSTRRRPAAPVVRAASSTSAVPRTLTSASSRGRRPTRARRPGPPGGDQASGATVGDERLQRSAVADVELRAARRRRAPARAGPMTRSSTTTTSSPRASSASATCEPMNPAPPVTIARIGTARIQGGLAWRPRCPRPRAAPRPSSRASGRAARGTGPCDP